MPLFSIVTKYVKIVKIGDSYRRRSPATRWRRAARCPPAAAWWSPRRARAGSCRSWRRSRSCRCRGPRRSRNLRRQYFYQLGDTADNLQRAYFSQLVKGHTMIVIKSSVWSYCILHSVAMFVKVQSPLLFHCQHCQDLTVTRWSWRSRSPGPGDPLSGGWLISLLLRCRSGKTIWLQTAVPAAS